MNKKEYSLRLGGKERILLFGKTGFYQYIHEATKMDPIEWFGKFAKTEDDQKTSVINDIKDAAIIIYAGINTHADNNDLDNIPFDKVKKWVNGLDAQVLAAVIPFAFNAFTVEEEIVSKKEEALQADPLPGMK